MIVVPAAVGALVGALVASLLAYFLGLRRSRYERLEEKRAEVIAELSRLLFEVQNKYVHWYLPSLRGGHTPAEVRGESAEKGATAIESLVALEHYYHSNVAWLDLGTADRIEGAISELDELTEEYGGPGTGNTYFQVTDKGVEIANRMRDRIPAIRDELIREFRDILYPYKWRARISPRRLRPGPRRDSPPPASSDA